MRSVVFGCLSIVLVITSNWCGPTLMQRSTGHSPTSVAAVDDLDARLQEQRVALRDALAIVVEQVMQEFNQGLCTINEVDRVYTAFIQAELSLESDPEQRVALLLKNIDRYKSADGRAKAALDVGVGSIADAAKTQALRIQSEIMLTEEQIRQLPSEE